MDCLHCDDDVCVGDDARDVGFARRLRNRDDVDSRARKRVEERARNAERVPHAFADQRNNRKIVDRRNGANNASFSLLSTM